MTFDGPCLFLTCLETGQHEHASCPECGAARHGNVFQCRTCNVVWNAQWAAMGWDCEAPYFGGEPR